MPRSPLALALLLAVAAPLSQAHEEEEEKGIVHVKLDVDGVPAEGLLAVPHDGHARGLVVVAHGYRVPASGWKPHLLATAERGLLALAMDYPGDFQVRRGAAEIVAGALHVLEDHPDVEDVHLLSVSMGGAIAAVALAQAPPRPEGGPLFDSWIEVEGVSLLAATWAEASAVRHPAAADIVRETGGTPAEAPWEYADRSGALRAEEIALAGLRRAVIVHPANDGRVPYDQGRAMAAALHAARIPLDFHTVLRGDPLEQGTTLTGAVCGLAGQNPCLLNPLGLAGHASEVSTTHVVMRTAFGALWRIVEGEEPGPYREFLVDRDLGALPAA